MAKHIMTDEEMLEESRYQLQKEIYEAQVKLNKLSKYHCPNCPKFYGYDDEEPYLSMAKPRDPARCELCTIPDDIVECLSIIAKEDMLYE